MIPQSDWKWFGHAGHLCVGPWCRFHLCTEIGPYVVSTVGEYLPMESVREFYAQSRGVILTKRGEMGEIEYIQKVGFEDIGFNRKYETMIFRVTGHCNSPECGCGLPMIDGDEQDCEGYNTAKDATEGHIRMCLKWAER
jgi:hypothetical protein